MQKSSLYVMVMVALGLLGTVLIFVTLSMGGRISP